MIKQIVKKIFDKLPLKKMIIFESVPNLSDNTKAVFDEMISRGVNKKYKLVWLVDNTFKKPQTIKNVSYLYHKKGVFQKIRAKFLHRRAKCLISCNDFLESVTKGQVSFYLTHGMPMKSVRNYCPIPNGHDYCLITGEGLLDVTSYEFKLPKEKLIPLGFPRNDELIKTVGNNKGVLHTDCDKVIVWYPTFRQHKNGVVKAGTNAMPIIYDEDSAIKLNAHANEKGVLIVLKPHFAQDMDNIKKLDLTNIKFIDDSFFVENKISSYEFVAKCDALISDYSSIYFDYLLCDKPIGLVWEDIEEYKEQPGLIQGYESFTKGAHKIYDLEQMKSFIDLVASGEDFLQKERQEICKKVHYSADATNSQRVVDFILEKITNKR